ncbi:Synapsin, ATP binding domain protein [Oesophagostomum dentatum]|uniref:Synapsin, ATP binding domain protein n=1 Tax=Oesophagostomum dentatum TaxID=61180 RepID=A0A0B1TEC0_OESDE|nr:Synapsin, ATP binding domain protein [Oesophagostomum dentatum]
MTKSKYFRNPNEFPIRVEQVTHPIHPIFDRYDVINRFQADFPELDVLCTDNNLTIEINQIGRDPRTFCPQAAFVGPSATHSPQSKTILRSMIAAGIPFVNSHTSMIAFMDKNNLHQPTTFPVVISVNEGYQGIGKIKVNNSEELCDVEGMLQIMGKGDTEVQVEPYVELKYDLHVQKIGHDIKTFLRRGISKNWKSNVGSSVLEQIPTNDRHRQYLQAICEHVGRMSICSIDILVSKDGREYVHNVNDVIALFGESQEDDRRNAAALMRAILAPPPRLPSRPSMEHVARYREARISQHNMQRAPSTEKKPAEIIEKKELKEQPSNASQTSFADDTMGQLKRTFAGIFGDVG